VVGLAFQKAHQPLPQLIELLVVQHGVPLTRPRKRDIEQSVSAIIPKRSSLTSGFDAWPATAIELAGFGSALGAASD